MENETTQIQIPEMCRTHQGLLIRQVGYAPTDPWQAMVIAAQVALFQAVTCDPETHKTLGKDIRAVSGLGCLACHKPDAFGEIVAAGETGDIGAIKTLGDGWVRDAQKDARS